MTSTVGLESTQGTSISLNPFGKSQHPLVHANTKIRTYLQLAILGCRIVFYLCFISIIKTSRLTHVTNDPHVTHHIPPSDDGLFHQGFGVLVASLDPRGDPLVIAAACEAIGLVGSAGTNTHFVFDTPSKYNSLCSRHSPKGGVVASTLSSLA